MIRSEHKTRAATVAMLYQGGAQSQKDIIPAKVATLYRSGGKDPAVLLLRGKRYSGRLMLHPKISI